MRGSALDFLRWGARVARALPKVASLLGHHTSGVAAWFGALLHPLMHDILAVTSQAPRIRRFPELAPDAEAIFTTLQLQP
jgi:hypothetical protein